MEGRAIFWLTKGRRIPECGDLQRDGKATWGHRERIEQSFDNKKEEEARQSEGQERMRFFGFSATT
jgi:hypothetical protein